MHQNAPPDECLQLDRLSTYRDVQLQRPSAYELLRSRCNNVDWQYAVSSCALPVDRVSDWAVDVISQGTICVGIIADDSINIDAGHMNILHPSYCGWMCRSARSMIIANGSFIMSPDCNVLDDMRVEDGDVILYRYEPSIRQLKMMNARTGKSFMISNGNGKSAQPNAPMYITSSMNSIVDRCHIRLRRMKLSEQQQLQEPCSHSFQLSTSIDVHASD